jgi:predicted nucleic acid-binding protein
VTDCYLADLAKAHGLKLATFDARIHDPSVEQVSTKPPARPAT